VPLLSDLGHHHIPVVDAERRLAGMVTQSDLVAALYRGRLDQVTDFPGTTSIKKSIETLA
jgi:CBS domain-containing membrane protein